MTTATLGGSLTLDLAEPAWDDEIAAFYEPHDNLHGDELHAAYLALADVLLELRTSGVID